LQSIWTNSVFMPTFSPLKASVQAEVAIIGGGLAGILTAALLQQRGVDVVVLEADRIGSGQTAGTTAKLTAQHGLKYHQLAHSLGMDTAAAYAKINQQAVEHLQQLIQKHDISCDLNTCTSFLYSTAPSLSLQEEYDTCRELGMDVFLTQDTELPFPAQALGLLPAAPRAQVITAGNACWQGAFLALSDRVFLQETEQIAEQLRELNLNTDKTYAETFLQAMDFQQ